MQTTLQEDGLTRFTPESEADWIRLAVAMQQGKIEYHFYKEHNVVPTIETCLRQINAPTEVLAKFLEPVKSGL